ncbi:MAG: hypothetical protein ACNI27_13245 [Desulfovibrio sp.]
MRKVAYILIVFLIAIFVVGESYAAGPQETDLIVKIKKSSTSGKSKSKKIVKKTKHLENSVELYNIEIGKKSRTGSVNVQGSSGQVFSTSSGKNVKVKSKIGGVKVGTP